MTPPRTARGETTCDEPAPGLRIFQPRRGYRYAMEPFLLAAWALEGGMPRTALDLGCGSGVIALLLARLGVACAGFDLRPEWIALARRSAAASGLAVPFEVADMRRLDRPRADLALLNPPYFPAGQGPPSPDPWKAAARTELAGTLEELVAAGARLADRLCFVLPGRRGQEGERALARAGLTPARICAIDDALVLLEGDRRAAVCAREAAASRTGDAWSDRVRVWYARLGARLS